MKVDLFDFDLPGALSQTAREARARAEKIFANQNLTLQHSP